MKPDRTRRAHWRTDTHRFRYDPKTESILVWKHKSGRKRSIPVAQVAEAATDLPRPPAQEDPRQIPIPLEP